MSELWTCPACGRRFANVNQWHSCIEMALDEHLASKSEAAVAIYRAVEEALRECGELRIHPQKTRVAFIARMTFATVSLARRWADLSFILPAPIDDSRVRMLAIYGPTSFDHSVRLSSAADVDDDVRRWLAAAHARGEQETLDPGADVEEVVGTALERLMAPMRARVVAEESGLALVVPQYVAQAFGANPRVMARIRGELHRGEIVIVHDAPRLVLEDGLAQFGVGEGDRVDVFITADL